ncbi:MAG: glycosyltransferase family 2 protein [Ferrimicrobium sp.]
MTYDHVVVLEPGCSLADVKRAVRAVEESQRSGGVGSFIVADVESLAAVRSVRVALEIPIYLTDDPVDIAVHLAGAIVAGSSRYVVVSYAPDAGAVPDLLAVALFDTGSLGYRLRTGHPPSMWENPTMAGAIAFDRTILPALRAVPSAAPAFLLASFLGSVRDLATLVPVAPSPSAERISSAYGNVGVRERFVGGVPLCTIVVPTLDARAVRVDRLLESLSATMPIPYEVVIVDNGNCPQGYAGPVNSGIRSATSPYVAVINDDVIVTDGWWEPLQRAIDDGASVVFPHTQEFSRTDFSAWCFVVSQEILRRFRWSEGDFFDPGLRIWFQDSDLLLRLRNAGLPPRYIPQSVITHQFSVSLNDTEVELHQWVVSQRLRDQARFEERWGSRGLIEAGFAIPQPTKSTA